MSTSWGEYRATGRLQHEAGQAAACMGPGSAPTTRGVSRAALGCRPSADASVFIGSEFVRCSVAHTAAGWGAQRRERPGHLNWAGHLADEAGLLAGDLLGIWGCASVDVSSSDDVVEFGTDGRVRWGGRWHLGLATLQWTAPGSSCRAQSMLMPTWSFSRLNRRRV